MKMLSSIHNQHFLPSLVENGCKKVRPFSSSIHGNGRKSCQKFTQGWNKLSLSFLLVGACFFFATMASVDAQTFQYSRGWTNGKRSGGGQGGLIYGNGPYDLENPSGGISDDIVIPPGHLQMSLSPQSRFRGGEYTQYLVKRSANAKRGDEPMWIGTIVGMDGGSLGAAAGGQGQTANSNTNANPAPNPLKRRGSSATDF